MALKEVADTGTVVGESPPIRLPRKLRSRLNSTVSAVRRRFVDHLKPTGIEIPVPLQVRDSWICFNDNVVFRSDESLVDCARDNAQPPTELHDWQVHR